jgi:PAS domain S-box-containing protein
VFLLENDARLFVAHEAASDPGASSELGLPETLELSEFPILSAVLERQDGIILEDVSEVEMWKRTGKSSRVRSWMGMPIYSSNQALGLLLLSHSSPAVFSRDHLRLSRSLANSAAVAIQNARLYERAEIYAVELEGRIPEARPVQSMKRSLRERGSGISENWFKEVFRSAPVAMSVTSLPAGRLIEVNEAFERRFGLRGKNFGAGTIEDFRLWEDPSEWKHLLERLKCGTKVRQEVARLRTKSGNYDYVRFSAEAIDLEGQACLLLVTEDPPDLTTSNAQD